MVPASLRRRCEDGAAAVEFALVSVVLFVVLFAITDYGLYFNASLDVRSGVRDAARTVSLVNDATPLCGNDGTELAKALCIAEREAQVDPTKHDSAGEQISSVAVWAPSGWTPGKPLLVCENHKVNGLTGFVPIPSSHLQRKVVTIVEQPDTALAAMAPNDGATGLFVTDEGALGDWNSWCKP